ncbi:MAG TPA: site-2 protease family protein, partial [Oscillatoriaceae cyanobacterium]
MGNVRIARLFGIPIELNVSWFFIFFLVVWSLSAQIFPSSQPGLAAATYWGLGVVTSLLLFASLLLHELAHSLMGRRFGTEVKRITLFLFGGVSESTEEMPSPKAEFWIAIVGPLTSFVLGAIFLLLSRPTQGLPSIALGWLGIINIGLGVFNLIPGYPLDGGRVLRAIIWGITHNLKKATRWAAGVGEAVAV